MSVKFFITGLALIALFAIALSLPFQEFNEETFRNSPEELEHQIFRFRRETLENEQEHTDEDIEENLYGPQVKLFRVRRETEQERRRREQGWKVNPGINGDGRNTNVGVEVKRTGEKHDFEAGWSKNVHGPNKAKPSWHVGGTFHW